MEKEAKQHAESDLPNLKKSAKATGESIARKSQSVLKGVSSYVHEKLPHVQESAKETCEAIALKSQSVMEGVSSYMNENPLVSGLIGLSAGLILGILWSGVLKGNRLSNEISQAVQKKTRQIYHDTKEEAEHIVDAAR